MKTGSARRLLFMGDELTQLESFRAKSALHVDTKPDMPPFSEPPDLQSYDLVVLVRADSSPDGLEPYLRLKQDHPQIPFVLIDGEHQPQVADQILKAGFQDYLSQPELTVPLLERSIRYALERWEISKSLRDQEEQFRQLTEFINEVFILSDLETGELLHVSPALESIWGRDPENLYQNREGLMEAIHPEDREIVRKARAHGEVTDSPPDLEYRVIHRDGSLRWVRDKATIIEDGKGTPYRMARVIEDNTATKTLEQKLKQSNEDLQKFAYVISHDLQEPLRMITGYLELLENRFAKDLDEKANKYINEAVEGAERMKGMISDLLTYSRIKTRGQPFERVDATEVLDDILADFQQAIEARNATIAYDDLPAVLADRGQLRHLFQNLIENGIKFADTEDPRIEIEAVQNGDRWKFRVSDNGMGIDPNNQEDVFVIFRQLHGGENGGTGLGLALCRGIVERHGGKIWVESDGHNGSTFYFTLPSVSGDAI